MSTQWAGTNWIGGWTLFKRESWRFLKVWNQTLIAPAITTLLFLAIFNLALGGNDRMVGDVPFSMFIAPGLVMMTVVQNAFANTSSSLMLSKIQGVIVDLLMPPLAPSEITMALTIGGVVRGLSVGLVVFTAMYIFVPMPIAHPFQALAIVLCASAMMALLGMVAGLWAQSFDQMAAITNYIITPLTFLSGTFYSVKQLPGIWYEVSQFNPFYYMIDGFRYAILGTGDTSAAQSIIILGGCATLLWLATCLLIRSGYRLKS